MKVQIRDMSKLLKVFIAFIFSVMFMELVIGGGGRFFEIGPLTARMVLYVFAIGFSLFFVGVTKQLNRVVIYFTLSFLFLIVMSSVIGYVNGATTALIVEDLKPLSFFFVLPFFEICVRDRDDVWRIIKIIKIGSLFMAVLYILTVIGLLLKIINFTWFYAKMEPDGEVLFRSEGLFFYKGFIYLCIGFFFFMFEKGKMKLLGCTLIGIAIMLTLTRGFILMTFITVIFYLILIHKNKLVSITVMFSCAIALAIALPFLSEVIGDRSESDGIRYLQIREVIEKTTPFNFFIGDGFGIGTHLRPVHMEISYLEIFSKQGVVGLMFWLFVFLYISHRYFLLYNNKDKFSFYAPFYMSVIFVYLQSATNPYITNPIGLSMILVSLVVIDKSAYNES